MDTGPVDASLTDSIFVIVFSASLDTTVSRREVYTLLNFTSDVGGFASVVLILTYLVIQAWNSSRLQFYLVSEVFQKKNEEKEPVPITLTWTSLFKRCNRQSRAIRLKGLKRIDYQTDIVKAIRKSFIHDAVLRRLLNPAKRAQLKREGKFIIELDQLQDHGFTSPDSDDRDREQVVYSKPV